MSEIPCYECPKWSGEELSLSGRSWGYCNEYDEYTPETHCCEEAGEEKE